MYFLCFTSITNKTAWFGRSSLFDCPEWWLKSLSITQTHTMLVAYPLWRSNSLFVTKNSSPKFSNHLAWTSKNGLTPSGICRLFCLCVLADLRFSLFIYLSLLFVLVWRVILLFIVVTHIKKCTESPRQWCSWGPYKFRVFKHHTCSPKWPYLNYCSSRRSCRKNTPSMQNHTVHTSKEKKI